MKFKVHYILGLIIIGSFIAVSLRFRFEIKGILLEEWIEYEKTSGQIVSVSKGYELDNRQRKAVAIIKYNFEVENASYYSTSVNFAADMNRRDHYFMKYPIGKVVTVYYEKGNPEFSVLEPENMSFRVLRGPILLILIFISYLYLFVYKKSH